MPSLFKYTTLLITPDYHLFLLTPLSALSRTATAARLDHPIMGLRRRSAAPLPLLILGLVFSAFVFLSLLPTTASEDVEIGIDAEDPLVAHKAGSGSKKSGLFERLSRVLDTGAAEDDDGVPFTDEQWHATKDLGEPVDPSLMTFKMPSEMVDAWDKDKGLRILQQTMDGDLTGPMRGLVADVKDLHEAWAQPHLFRALMSQIPLFHAIKPIQAIVMGKNEEDYTAEDGVAAAGAFKGFMVKALDSMDVLRNPERLAEKMLTYASSKDKTLLDLFAKAARGEDENHKEINNFFLKKELGDCECR